MDGTPTIALNDGTRVPLFAYGTATALYHKDAKDWVKMAYQDANMRHIDTAACYQNENTVGAALKELAIERGGVFITTKCGENARPRQSLVESLKLMGVEYVDLYLIHDPTWTGGLSLSEAWSEMEALRKEGKARSIGVSNYRLCDLEETLQHAKVIPSMNQIEVHPYVYPKAKPIIDLCHSKGIKIAVYTALAPLTAFPGGPVDAVVARIADELGATADQVLMKWAHQVTYGGVIVTTSSKKNRLLGQMKALIEMKGLSAEQIQEIADAGAKKHQRVYVPIMDE